MIGRFRSLGILTSSILKFSIVVKLLIVKDCKLGFNVMKLLSKEYLAIDKTVFRSASCFVSEELTISPLMTGKQ
jgi:hypothetical protein